MTMTPNVRVKRKKEILAFDLETMAAGFADPNWVPQKITCVAWKWMGSVREPHVMISDKAGFFEPELRREMLAPFMESFRAADAVLGHNLLRFDLPVLNAELLRLGMEPLGPVMVHDSIRLLKTKGFKKGLDNMAELLKVPIHKQAMSWQQWEDAYEQDGWPEVVSRCQSDVEMQIIMYERAREAGWLRPPTLWRP